MKYKTVIICRTNAPLMQMAVDLKRRCPGLIFRFIGRDIAKTLKDFVIEVLEWRRNINIDEFRVLLDSWINDIRDKCRDIESKEQYWAEREDAYAQIVMMSEGCKNSNDIMEEIDKTFVDADKLEDDPNVLVFASGHRSKGLEWEREIVIRTDLMPHPCAKSPEDLVQEEHIKYVVLTRAKQILILCHEKRPDPQPSQESGPPPKPVSQNS